MKLIQLNKFKGKQGLFAIVDDDWFERLNQWNWSARKGRKTFYAFRCFSENGVKKEMQMHRLIMGVTDTNIEIDHKDHNGLNNQIENLRICTYSQQGANRSVKKNSSSKYRGVCKYLSKARWKKKNGEVVTYTYLRWDVCVGKDGIRYTVGKFKTEIEAAMAYDEAAKKLHGEFANLNFK